MSAVPETLYARAGSLHVAYQAIGDGPDLLFVPPVIFPIDLIWDEPTVAGHLRRLASFSRLIPTDLLGAGSSAFDDRGSHELKGVPDTWARVRRSCLTSRA
jgi:hypothetical protein